MQLTNDYVISIKKYLKFKFGDNAHYNMTHFIGDTCMIFYYLTGDEDDNTFRNINVKTCDIKRIVRQVKIKEILDGNT